MEKKSILVVVAIFTLLLVNISFHVYNWYSSVGRVEDTSANVRSTTVRQHITSKATKHHLKTSTKQPSSPVVDRTAKRKSVSSHVKKSKSDGSIKISYEKVIKFYPGPVKFLSPKEQVEVEHKLISRPRNLDEFLDNNFAMMNSMDPFGLPVPSLPRLDMNNPESWGRLEAEREPVRVAKPKVNFFGMIFKPSFGMERPSPRPDPFLPLISSLSGLSNSGPPGLPPGLIDAIFRSRPIPNQPQQRPKPKTIIILLPPKVIRLNVKPEPNNQQPRRHHQQRIHKIHLRPMAQGHPISFGRLAIVPPFRSMFRFPHIGHSRQMNSPSKNANQRLVLRGHAEEPTGIKAHLEIPYTVTVEKITRVHPSRPKLVLAPFQPVGQQRVQQKLPQAPVLAAVPPSGIQTIADESVKTVLPKNGGPFLAASG